MNLTIRFLGLELLSIDASTEDAAVEPDGSGTTTSTFGFIAESTDMVGLPDRWGEE